MMLTPLSTIFQLYRGEIDERNLKDVIFFIWLNDFSEGDLFMYFCENKAQFA